MNERGLRGIAERTVAIQTNRDECKYHLNLAKMNLAKNGDALPGESVKILKEPRLGLSCHWILEVTVLMRNKEDKNNEAES